MSYFANSPSSVLLPSLEQFNGSSWPLALISMLLRCSMAADCPPELVSTEPLKGWKQASELVGEPERYALA